MRKKDGIVNVHWITGGAGWRFEGLVLSAGISGDKGLESRDRSGEGTVCDGQRELGIAEAENLDAFV